MPYSVDIASAGSHVDPEKAVCGTTVLRVESACCHNPDFCPYGTKAKRTTASPLISFDSGAYSDKMQLWSCTWRGDVRNPLLGRLIPEVPSFLAVIPINATMLIPNHFNTPFYADPQFNALSVLWGKNGAHLASLLMELGCFFWGNAPRLIIIAMRFFELSDVRISHDLGVNSMSIVRVVDAFSRSDTNDRRCAAPLRP
jgi:hypothetical protein